MATTLIPDAIYERTLLGQRALVFDDLSWSDEAMQVLSLVTGETPLGALRDLLASQAHLLDAALPRLLDAGLVRAREPEARH